MRSTKLGRKVLAGILCASMVFQSVSVSTYASEREEQTVSESVAYDAEGDSSSSVEENTASSADEEEDSTSPADKDNIPTEDYLEKIIMSVSAEEGLDNKGESLYLHINSNKNSDPEFAKIPWKECRYIITSVEDSENSASSEDAEYLDIRTISADEAIVKLKKPDSVKDASQLSVKIIYDDIKKVIKPSKETTSDPTEDDFVEVTVHTTVAQDNIELKSGILFLSYNPVNCKLNMAVTSDIGTPTVTVITADGSEEYRLEKVGSASSITDGGEIVKLDRNTKYFVRFIINDKTYQQEITWGEYKDGVPSEKKPTTIEVYRPYEFKPILTYTTDTSDITQMVNGVSKYLFSKRFLESRGISPKDEVYNIEFLDAAGNRITEPLTNVVLAEDKWDRTYKIETKDGEMEKDEPVELYYGNEDYSSITLTIENAKAEPELIFSNAALMNYVIQKINGSDTSYTATLTVNATGETDVTVKVGDIEEKFHVSIKRPEKIKKIFFADDLSTKKDITLEGIGKEAAVVIAIDPKMALIDENDIIVSSSDDTVVKFKQITDAEAPEGASDNTDEEDSYAYRRITMISTGIGEAEITIKVNGSTEPDKELRCKVTVVNGTFTDAQKQNLQRQVGTLYAATNITSRLGEIALPKDWEWVYPDTELKIDPDGNIKTYEARCSKESYLPFTVFLPVGVTEVTGAYITGDDELTVKHTGSYQLHLRLDGYNVPLEKNKSFADYLKSIVSCSWQGDSLLTVNNQNGWETTATAGVVELSAEAAVRATVVVGDETFREDFNVVILADHITELAIIPKESVKNRLKFTFNENEKAAYVYDKDLAGNADTIILTATARMENRNYPVSRGTLSWKVNDENLATIIEQDDGTAVLRVLGSGTIIVTATAEDAGRKEATLAVEVRDYAPLFDMKNILINIYSTEGVELPVYAVEGNPITRISIGDTNFRVEKNNERFYLMIVNKSAYVSKTVIDTTMNIRTRMSIDVDIPIKITVDTSKPKITFKAKTAPNVFFTDTTAVYTVNSSYDIIDITNDIDKDSVITKGFEVTGYNSTTKQLTIRAKGLTADNVHEFLDKKLELNNVKVLVRYKNYGTISETIKLSLQNKKPSYKIREISTVNARPSYQTYLYNNSDKTEIALSTNAVITSTTDRVTAEVADTGRILVKYDDVKSKSYKLSIQDKNWTSPIALTGKISIVKSLATVLGSKSVTLNMAHNMTTNGIVTIPVEAKNNLTSLSKVDLTGANKKSADLLSSGYLDIRFNTQKQQLEVGLKETRPASIKAGTYTIAVVGYLQQGSSGEVALTKANLKVVLVSKVPAVKLTAKSSINLIDRENTAIIYTPKISNMTTSIKKVTTSGENSGFFRARLLSDGKIEVRAVSNVQLRKGTSYTLGLQMEFDNNTNVTTNVRIKPTNKLPSIKASATKATIYKVSANPIRYEVYNAGTFGNIESITLVESKASANFNFSVSKDNVVTVSLKPEVKRTIKNGKYTISYQVKMKDAAINSNPKTLKMTITVK